MRWWAYFVACCLIIPAVTLAATGPAEQEFQKARNRYYTLINSAQTGEETEWITCIDMFRQVSQKYPQSQRAPDALFTEALLYWNMHQRFGRTQNLYSALDAYKRLVETYTNDSLADDALYNSAVIYNEDLGDRTKALELIDRLISRYPKSEMATQARRLSKKLTSNSSATISTVIEDQLAPNVTDKSTTEQSLSILDIRTWSNPDFTRVSIYLSGSPATYMQQMLDRDAENQTPNRLLIDIPKTRLAPKLTRQIDMKDTLLLRVRSGQFTEDVARVVLDMQSVYDYQIATRTNPDRIIIDVQGKQPKAAPTISEQSAVAQVEPQLPAEQPSVAPAPVEPPPALKSSEAQAAPKPNTKTHDEQWTVEMKPSNVRTVILDPGHGGDDPGARGPSGAEEKQVVLEIALKLRKLLQQQSDLKVVMTRDKDVFIPLDQRSSIANNERGELFVSIHANADPKHKASGVSTYIFDNAKDEYSKRLEDLENASILKGDKNEPDFLTMMFKSMTKNYFTNQSVELAALVQNSLVHGLTRYYHNVRDLGVRQAMFYVLWNTEMPSILVETSFITNRDEEKRLRDEDYQMKMAESIAKGIQQFFYNKNAIGKF